MLPPLPPARAIELTVREEWGRILASLVRTLGDFQLAEDCLQDAVVAAMQAWEKTGMPASPAAWLLTTARRRAIDRLRRVRTHNAKAAELSYLRDLEAMDMPDDSAVPDKRLEMIFTCCHPALEEKTRVALTLRTLGGLTTDEIAAAFLDKPDAMAQRLVRARRKIAQAGIPYHIPDRDVLPARISSVLSVIYLIFNEGYAARSGENLTRSDLSDEAIRLARIVRALMPDEAEVAGLLSLMLLHDSRRFARVDKAGDMVALEHQSRARWDRAKIAEGTAILDGVWVQGQIGPYQVQAAISALHAKSPSWAATDWPQIAALYAHLYHLTPSPVIRLNQAMALSYVGPVDAALSMLDESGIAAALDRYQPYYAARADLLARAGRPDDARAAYETAIALSDNRRERAFLTDKIAALTR